MVVRAGIVAFAFWGLWGCATQITYPLSRLLQGDVPQMLLALIDWVSGSAPMLLLAAGLALFEGRLVRWIVPYPPREATCPQCGYSLKNLKSPICPECGADFK